MLINIEYGERRYGNDYPNPNYTATVKQGPFGDGVVLELVFAKPQEGRGANWQNRGYVVGADFRLTEDEARSIAAALLWHLECAGRETLHLSFGDTSGDA